MGREASAGRLQALDQAVPAGFLPARGEERGGGSGGPVNVSGCLAGLGEAISGGVLRRGTRVRGREMVSGLHVRGSVALRVRMPWSVGREHAGEAVRPQCEVSPRQPAHWSGGVA